MNIQDLGEKIKPFYTPLLLVVIGAIFFAFGRLSVLEERHTPIKIQYPDNTQSASALQAFSAPSEVVATSGGEVIGVKTSKKYYFPWCGTLKRTKVENQVHFVSSDLAKENGYVPGGGCKGLQ